MKNKTIIIAEAGVNHNGKLSIAKKLIDLAKDAGADIIKFQTFKSKNLLIKKTKKAKYQTRFFPNQTQYEMLKKLELNFCGMHIKYGEFLVELVKSIIVCLGMYKIVNYLIQNTDFFE